MKFFRKIASTAVSIILAGILTIGLIPSASAALDAGSTHGTVASGVLSDSEYGYSFDTVRVTGREITFNYELGSRLALSEESGTVYAAVDGVREALPSAMTSENGVIVRGRWHLERDSLTFAMDVLPGGPETVTAAASRFAHCVMRNSRSGAIMGTIGGFVGGPTGMASGFILGSIGGFVKGHLECR